MAEPAVPGPGRVDDDKLIAVRAGRLPVGDLRGDLDRGDVRRRDGAVAAGGTGVGRALLHAVEVAVPWRRGPRGWSEGQAVAARMAAAAKVLATEANLRVERICVPPGAGRCSPLARRAADPRRPGWGPCVNASRVYPGDRMAAGSSWGEPSMREDEYGLSPTARALVPAPVDPRACPFRRAESAQPGSGGIAARVAAPRTDDSRTGVVVRGLSGAVHTTALTTGGRFDSEAQCPEALRQRHGPAERGKTSRAGVRPLLAACRAEHEPGKWSRRRVSNPRHPVWKATGA